MKTEYQVTPELSLLVCEDGNVEYSLHNRIYPQAHLSSILSLQELEASIKKQVDVLRIHTKENFDIMYRLEVYIRNSFIGGNSYTGKIEGMKHDQ